MSNSTKPAKFNVFGTLAARSRESGKVIQWPYARRAAPLPVSNFLEGLLAPLPCVGGYVKDGWGGPGDRRDSPPESLKEAALAYAARGWRIVPVHHIRPDGSCSCGKADCKSPGKHPRTPHGQKDATCDPEVIAKWWDVWPEANIAVFCQPSGLAVVDVDPRNGGDETLAALEQEHGELTSSLVAHTGGGGKHIFYAAPQDGAKLPGKIGKGIDFKNNGYVLLAPSNHKSGERYRWANGGVAESGELESLPQWIINGPEEKMPPRPAPNKEQATPIDADEFHAALFSIPNDESVSYDDWLKVGAGVHDHTNGREDGFALFDRWSELNGEKYDPDTTRKLWGSLGKYQGRNATALTIFKMAREHGWRPLYELGDRLTGDVALARQFAKDYACKFRYVAQNKEWLHWDGIRWNPDLAEQQAFKHMQDFIAGRINAAYAALLAAKETGEKATITAATNDFLAICAYHKDARKLKTLFSIIPRQAGIFTSALEYDRDPWLLGVRNGVIDLRTGELLAPDQKNNITKLAGCAYNPNAKCPKFTKFLERVLPDPDVREFMHRRAGYTLTGNADEEKLFFDHGKGANGKSVFINIVKEAMGDYGVVIRAETLMSDRFDTEAKHDITRLFGARLAQANETSEGAIWNDQRVKDLSSREHIRARKLYKEAFDFPPTHKLWIRGNNTPGVKDATDGFWRRMIPTAWGVTIPDEEKIADLDKRIIAEELEGVLAWMVRGAIKWAKDGLQIPQSVEDERLGYKQETDIVGRWIEENLDKKEGARTAAVELYRDFQKFCESLGMHPMSEFALGRALVARHFKPCKMHGRRGYENVAVKPSPTW